MRSILWFWPLLGSAVGCVQQNASLTTPASQREVLVPPEIEELARRYSIRIEVLPKPTRWAYFFRSEQFTLQPPTLQQVSQCVPLLSGELTRYPPAFIRRLKLRRIVLCGDITRNDTRLNGVAPEGEVYLSLRIDPGESSVYERYWQRHAFHHELFHLLDRLNGEAWDVCWRALNPDGFRYGQTACEYGHKRLEGFAHLDSQSGLKEDQAHLFAWMVGHYAAVCDLADRDPIIGKKVGLLQQLVAEFDPTLDEAFWTEAKRLSRQSDERVLAAVWNGWINVKPGIDPFASGTESPDRSAIVRPTRFPGFHCYRFEPRKLTHLNADCQGLIAMLYRTSSARCVVPEALKRHHYDVIVSLPDSDPPSRVTAEAREAFESTFGIRPRKETRVVDVYVMRLGPAGSRRLERLTAENERRRRSHPSGRNTEADLPELPSRTIWQRLLGAETLSSTIMSFGRDMPFEVLAPGLEGILGQPVIDETGFKKPICGELRFDSEQIERRRRVLEEVFGVELTKDRRPVELTIIEERFQAPTTQTAAATPVVR